MQTAWEGVEQDSLQSLTQCLKEISAHLQEMQEKVNSLPQQVGKAGVQLALAVLELAWYSQVAMLSHLGFLHLPHFR